MAASLKTQLQNALTEARKGRDKLRTQLLSMTLSELRNREIEDGGEAGDATVQEVLTRARKRRKEAADQMRAGGREELALKEEEEADILAAFLPEELSEDEVRALIRAIREDGVTEMGPLMGRLMPQLKGRFDGKEANRLVREVMGS